MEYFAAYDQMALAWEALLPFLPIWIFGAVVGLLVSYVCEISARLLHMGASRDCSRLRRPAVAEAQMDVWKVFNADLVNSRVHIFPQRRSCLPRSGHLKVGPLCPISVDATFHA